MQPVRMNNRDFPRFVPDYYANSVTDIDFDELKRQGITCVAFDADSTLVPFSLLPFQRKAMRKQSLAKLQNARSKFRKFIIASNRPTNDLQELASTIDAEVVRASLLRRKPRRAYFNCVFRQAGVPPEQIVMVGDKLLADIYGAKRQGMLTVWVKNIGKDNPLDRLLQTRRLEKWLIKNYMKRK